METPTIFRCRHVSCNHIGANAMRLPYRSASARNKHERKGVHHHCTPSTCSACASHKGELTTATRIPPTREEGYPCGHTNGCRKVYSSQNNTVRHELKQGAHIGCLQPCPRCNAASQSWKRKREEEEAQERAVQEEIFRQKEAQIAKLSTTLQNINWDEARQARDLQELEQKQAEVM